MAHTEKQRRAALKAAKKLMEAHQSLYAYWDACLAGQEKRADHTVIKLQRDLSEEAAFIEMRYGS